MAANLSSLEPMVTTAPAPTVTSEKRAPSKNDPFVELRSLTRMPFSATCNSRCCRETAVSESTSAQPGALPTRYVPRSSSICLPWSGPDSTTSRSLVGTMGERFTDATSVRGGSVSQSLTIRVGA